MTSTASIVLLGLGIVAAFAGVVIWLAVRRPSYERQRRDEALAAAQQVTPAARVSPYGAPPVVAAVESADPCAPGLSDSERVEAMRALLRAPREPAAELIEDPMTTSPMAWNPTLPQAEVDVLPPAAVHERDREHITL